VATSAKASAGPPIRHDVWEPNPIAEQVAQNGLVAREQQ
jgi:hypothetical protein